MTKTEIEIRWRKLSLTPDNRRAQACDWLVGPVGLWPVLISAAQDHASAVRIVSTASGVPPEYLVAWQESGRVSFTLAR